jgi:AcrR family transcriptional regulator
MANRRFLGSGSLAQDEKPASSSRGKILEAAVRVAIRDGVVAVTLDAVAKEAQVSKGGLLYHFRSKDDLIAAMLEDFCSKTWREFEAQIDADPNPRGRWFRAFVHTVFPAGDVAEGAAGRPEMSRFLTAILIASANNPSLLEQAKRNMSHTREKLLAEGPNGVRQVALWPAIYGLLLWQHLGAISPENPLWQSILNELLSLAEGPETPGAAE